MPIIDENSPANTTDSNQYYSDELQNLKILLFEVDKGINTLIKSGHKSYQLDTSQSNQSVQRLDLFQLRELRENLLYQIREIEIFLGLGKPSVINVNPGW